MEKTIDVKTSRPVLRHKMYKSGKKWIVAGIAGAAAMTYSMTVHADTTSQQVTTNSTQDVNAGGNAVTSTGTQTNNNTTTTLNVSAASSQSQPSTNALSESKAAGSQQGTIYTPVNVDHSKLDNAVKQASDAGVRMVHDNDTVQNTTNENVDSARQAIEDQYNDQIADINRQAAHARQETSNYNNYNGNQGDHSGLDQAVQNAQSVPGLTISKSNNQNTTVDPANDSQINQWKTNTQNDYSSQTAAINNAIATQKQNNQEYDAAYKDWQSKNAANEAKYQSQMADYHRKLEEYNQTINGKPTITSNGNTKLVGTTGTPGSIGYYSGMAVVTTDDGYTSLGQVSWNSNTSLIGTSKRASLTSKQGQVADGNLSDFYDITDVVRNNGSIILTNVAHDGYGINYDLKLTFANTDTSSTGKVILGPANDGSIEFDFYGGYQLANAGLNISSMQFVYHGTNVAAPVLMNSLFSDLDVRQSFNTNLGNVIAWTPNNSHVSILGDNYVDNSSKDEDDQGFNSSPKAPELWLVKDLIFIITSTTGLIMDYQEVI